MDVPIQVYADWAYAKNLGSLDFLPNKPTAKTALNELELNGHHATHVKVDHTMYEGRCKVETLNRPILQCELVSTFCFNDKNQLIEFHFV